MSAVEDRLAELGLILPDVAKPVAAYVPALRDGTMIFTSGQLPMVSGALAQTGKVGTGDGNVAPRMPRSWPRFAPSTRSLPSSPSSVTSTR